MTVDSYKWLPRRLQELYRAWPAQRAQEVPFTPLRAPLQEMRLGLVTTAGIYVEGLEPPFDTERERREPSWGDPTFRSIPRDAPRDGIGTSHLHINNEPVRRDLNTVLCLDLAEDAVAEGRLGGLADTHFSLMGYQLDSTEWQRRTVPEVSRRLREQQVDVALITPT
jgi:D-proline reductase (dithiol) PrdB